MEKDLLHRHKIPARAGAIPATLFEKNARSFWLVVILTGVTAGLAAAALTRLLEAVQRWTWGGSGRDLLDSAMALATPTHIFILLGAGLATGVGQLVLHRLTSGNGIDITEALWFHAGKLPALRTLGSAILSVIVVGMGVSLGREGAPKQAGAVFANFFSNWTRLSDEQRRLLVACGAGAGMAAAYGVPLGGALFALEVLRGALALRLILPALLASLIATCVSWLFLPDAPTYVIPAFSISVSVVVWSLFLGPVAGIVSVGYVRTVAWADRNRPKGWKRVIAPAMTLGLVGLISGQFPQVLGNGKDIAQLAFMGQVAPAILVMLLLLRPLCTLASLGSGVPGGLFTPTLAIGALLGGVLGYGWTLLWPGIPSGLFALIGATALLAASTQGPISAVVLIMEMTGQDRSFIVPVLLAVVTATLVARTIEPRSIYEARLTDEQVEERLRTRQPSLGEPASTKN